MKKNLPIVFAISAILLLCNACFNSSNSKMSAVESMAVNIGVKQLKSKLPMDLDYGLVLTDVEYDKDDNTVIYRCEFSIDAKAPSAELLAEAKNTVVDGLRYDEDVQELLSKDIKLRYEYFDRDGNFLYCFDISQDDFRGAPHFLHQQTESTDYDY